ncbi:hypothetical protein BpHYR1_033863 [Brachionus plicatilis]|uniref:Uncharacterized protein n=1 Tax=Brachionus plicatilis TaxID=10195 RepID=A0A3M7P3D7_BRAPC|nr:hypothetical protein BpHYR1_033863 [Brachionus plicatilis]
MVRPNGVTLLKKFPALLILLTGETLPNITKPETNDDYLVLYWKELSGRSVSLVKSMNIVMIVVVVEKFLPVTIDCLMISCFYACWVNSYLILPD